MLAPYEVLWRYFAWCNQALSVFTLWAITVWLARERKQYIVTLVPALFMTCVTVTYIFFAPEGFSALTDTLFGTQISYPVAVGIGVAAAAVMLAMFAHFVKGLKGGKLNRQAS